MAPLRGSSSGLRSRNFSRITGYRILTNTIMRVHYLRSSFRDVIFIFGWLKILWIVIPNFSPHYSIKALLMVHLNYSLYYQFSTPLRTFLSLFLYPSMMKIRTSVNLLKIATLSDTFLTFFRIMTSESSHAMLITASHSSIIRSICSTFT